MRLGKIRQPQSSYPKSLLETSARVAFEAHGRATHSPVIAALQRHAIPSLNDGAPAILSWITFSVVSASTARGADVTLRPPQAVRHRRDRAESKKWLPTPAPAAAAVSRRASCASWCNSSVTTPTSSRSAPASVTSTRRRLTRSRFTQVRRERHPRHPEPAGPREAPPELLPHGEARLLPAATQQLRLPPRRLDAGPRPSTTAGPQVPQGRGRGHDAHGEPPRAAPALAPQARARAAGSGGAPAAPRARGAAQARADRVRRERGDAPAVVHAARGLAPRARRAGRRVSEAFS